MKKIQIISIFIALIFINFNSFSQNDKDKNLGFRGGWQSSNYYENGDSQGADPYNSFYLGLTRERKIVPLLHFGIGLEYFQNGSNYSLLGKDYTFRAHTLSVPLFLKVKLGPVFLLGGAGTNFTLSQSIKSGSEKIDMTSEDEIKGFDVPLFGGIGLEVLMFTFEARYHYGLLDASKPSSSSPHVQYFQLGAGIHF